LIRDFIFNYFGRNNKHSKDLKSSLSLSYFKFILLIFFYFLLLLLIVLLFNEYSNLKLTISQLNKIKGNYEEHIQLFKQLELKKKVENKKDFIILNRDKPSNLNNLNINSKSSFNINNKKYIQDNKQDDINLNKIKDKLNNKNILVDPSEKIFILPIDKDKFWLSSPFGLRKTPSGKFKFHFGIDMAALKGTNVNASSNGIVTEAKYSKSYGKTIVITHNNKFKTRYAHLDQILVKLGDTIKQGALIGRVGSTGNVRKGKMSKDPSHLHFEIHRFGQPVNPYFFFK